MKGTWKKAVHGAISNMPVGVEMNSEFQHFLDWPIFIWDGFEHLSGELRRLTRRQIEKLRRVLERDKCHSLCALCAGYLWPVPNEGKFPNGTQDKTLCFQTLDPPPRCPPTQCHSSSTEQHYNMFESHYMHSGNPCQQSEEPPLDSHD
jgi:hypothetical protein